MEIEIPCLDGTLYRRGPAPAGQQGSVDIEAAETRCIQYCLGQYQAVGYHDHDVGLQRFEALLLRLIAQGNRLGNRQAGCECELFDRTLVQLLPPSRGAIGLGEDA